MRSPSDAPYGRQHNFEEIVGASDAIRRVLNDVAGVAGTDASVLIRGETGTGKELIARAIHSNSNRSGKPLIKVNCAALPASSTFTPIRCAAD